MEAFNIKIIIAGKATTFTILPDADEFKIIYFGGIIGALNAKSNHLDFIAQENVSPGSLPLYKYKQADSTVEEPEIILTEAILDAIRNEVKLVIAA